MHLFHIPQCTIQNRILHISVLNGVLWDMEKVHCGICENALLRLIKAQLMKKHVSVCEIYTEHDDKYDNMNIGLQKLHEIWI